MTPRHLAIACLALMGAAHAHVGDLFGGMDVMLTGPGSARGIDASFGLLWADDGVDYTFICHEAILAPGAFESPSYARSVDGAFLAVVQSRAVARVTDEPVYRSVDGCTWDPVSGLFDARIVGLATHPVDGSQALAVTGDLEEGAINQVYESSDGGATWAPGTLALEGAFFRGVSMSATGTRWMTSIRADLTAASVHRSVDGETWDAEPMALTPREDERVVLLDVLAASPTDPDTAWLVRGPIGGPDEVLHTTDAGATVEVIYTAPGDVVDGAATDDGSLWLIQSNGEVLVARDGRTVTPAPADTPRAVGIDTRAGELVMVTRDSLRDGALAASTDSGETWQQTPVLDLIGGAIECPA
jgi:hypothetical protein